MSSLEFTIWPLLPGVVIAFLALIAIGGGFVIASRFKSFGRAALPLASAAVLLAPICMNLWCRFREHWQVPDSSDVAGGLQRLTFMFTMAIGIAHFAILLLVAYYKGFTRVPALRARPRTLIATCIVCFLAVVVAMGASAGSLVLGPRASRILASGSASGAIAGGIAGLALVAWLAFVGSKGKRGGHSFRPVGRKDSPDDTDDTNDAAGAAVPRPRSPPGLSGRAVSSGTT